MTPPDSNAPAFPFAEMHTHGAPYTQWKGMNLRDYFAAKAMQGMIGGTWPTSEADQKYIAEFSYELADAMLKARTA